MPRAPKGDREKRLQEEIEALGRMGPGDSDWERRIAPKERPGKRLPPSPLGPKSPAVEEQAIEPDTAERGDELAAEPDLQLQEEGGRRRVRDWFRRRRGQLFGDGEERVWARVRSLFVPTVSVVAVCDLIGLDDAEDAAKQLYDWERDRLFTLAKGLGAASVGVVTTLLIDAAESKVTSTTLAWLASALVAMLLLWAGFILTGLRRLAEEYPVALTLLRAGKP
jgi:hypothetical protein